MEEDLDPNIIKATQISLGKYVKRPPLSDKLLRKPPFRFLHDIVTSVLKSKGFFGGLFEDNELISENVKDRESKIDFLNKVVTVVSLTTGESLSVKPSKIVAGQEPAKTNKLLQCLARALDENLSSDEAVKQFKAGLKIHPTSDKKSKESVKSVKKNIDIKKLTSKSSEKLVTNEKNGQLLKSKHRENTILKKESPPKKPASKVSNKKPIEKSKQEVFPQEIDSIEQKNKMPVKKKIVSDSLAVQDTEQKNILLNKDNVALDEESRVNEKKLQPVINLHEGIDISGVTVSIQEQAGLDENGSISQPTTADNSIPIIKEPDEVEIKINKDVNIKDNILLNTHKNEMNVEDNKNKLMQENDDNGATEAFKEEFEENRNSNVNAHNKKDINDSTVIIRPSSVRPSSSRPGAPRLRNKSDNIINDTENILVGKVNIITENSLQEEDDEDTSIIVENHTTEELQEKLQDQEHNLAGNQSSHLVQQILDSQKEYSQTIGKTEIEWQFGAQKTPDVFIQEMEQLKFNVQALSRTANPLGKLLDHIQEDVEVMRQELHQWTKLYEDTSKDLLKQQTGEKQPTMWYLPHPTGEKHDSIASEESMLPFHTKLKQLAVDIREKHDKITDLKVCIHKNASRIDKLLASGNVQ